MKVFSKISLFVSLAASLPLIATAAASPPAYKWPAPLDISIAGYVNCEGLARGYVDSNNGGTVRVRLNYSYIPASGAVAGTGTILELGHDLFNYHMNVEGTEVDFSVDRVLDAGTLTESDGRAWLNHRYFVEGSLKSRYQVKLGNIPVSLVCEKTYQN